MSSQGMEASPTRLPFAFDADEDGGKLTLSTQPVDWMTLDHLELHVPGAGIEGAPPPRAVEKFQRRRLALRGAKVRIDQRSLDRRLAHAEAQLRDAGVSLLKVRLEDGYVAVRCRFAEGLVQADVAFHIYVIAAGATVRVAAGSIHVFGYVPVPGPLIVDRILATLLGLVEVGGTLLPSARGLCDVELDVLDTVLWALLPPAGWRLPSTRGVELAVIRTTTEGIVIGYGPTAAQPAVEGDWNLRRLTAAHDAMRSTDDMLRQGQVEEAMRAYRALLASGGPNQPILIERLLSLSISHTRWFLDGVELARQALVRWPQFAPAWTALAVVAQARGDAREAARHFSALADRADEAKDFDTAALASLSGARLLRISEPQTATRLLERAVDRRPDLDEAADALIERYAEEGKWSHLVSGLRARAMRATAPADAGQLLVRAAEVLAGPLADIESARAELARASELSERDVTTLCAIAVAHTAIGGSMAETAWLAVLSACDLSADDGALIAHANIRAQAWVALAALTRSEDECGDLLRRAVAADGEFAPARLALARWAVRRGDHQTAVEQYTGALETSLDPAARVRAEVERAESQLVLGERGAAVAALRRATADKSSTGALALALLGRLALDELVGATPSAAADADVDRALDAMAELVATAQPSERADTDARAAELAQLRARLREERGDMAGAAADWERVFDHSRSRDPSLSLTAAMARLGYAKDAAETRRWIDAAIATAPAGEVRGDLLLRRARLAVPTNPRGADAEAVQQDLLEALRTLRDPELIAVAHRLEAGLRTSNSDARGRAQALADQAKWTSDGHERAGHEIEAATAWLSVDDPAPALELAQSAATALGDANAAARAWELVAEAAWRLRRWPETIRGLSSLASTQPLDVTQRYRLAFSLDRAGDAAAAGTLLAGLVTDGVSGSLATSVHRLRVEQAERAGQPSSIAAALEALAAAEDNDEQLQGPRPAQADAWHRAAELYRRDGNFDAAVRCCEEALRRVEGHLPSLDCLELIERSRGDLQRVTTILGRKIAATARHPQRQKALLARLGELWVELGQTDVARAAFARALEIDREFRPALRFVAADAADREQWRQAVEAYRALSGKLSGDASLDDMDLTRERTRALVALDRISECIPSELRAELRLGPPSGAALGVDQGEGSRVDAGDGPGSDQGDEPTHSGRIARAQAKAAQFRSASDDARRSGRLEDAFASLEAANQIDPGHTEVLRELADLACELGDYVAAAAHLRAMAEALVAKRRPSRRADVLLELAEIYEQHMGDAKRARQARWTAIESLPAARRDITLRVLATDASRQGEWAEAHRAFASIVPAHRTTADFVGLATALRHLGRLEDARTALEQAASANRLDDAGAYLQFMIGQELEARNPPSPAPQEPVSEADERRRLLLAMQLLREVVGDESAAAHAERDLAELESEDPATTVPVDEDRLIAELARRRGDTPDAFYAWLTFAEARTEGRIRAHLLMERAFHVRDVQSDSQLAAQLLATAHEVAPDLVAVWIPLAETRANANDLAGAKRLYTLAAASDELDPTFRAWASARADELRPNVGDLADGIPLEPSILGATAPIPLVPPPPAIDAVLATHAELSRAKELANQGALLDAISHAERAAVQTQQRDENVLAVLDELYAALGDVDAQSEILGRQLQSVDDPAAKAAIWRRRARMYRGVPDREAEAHRCLLEAHALVPTDPQLAYALRMSCMARGEWPLAAQLLYREIAAAPTDRERGALHLELGLIYDDRLGELDSARLNYEQALQFDPTIPAALVRLAKHYEAAARYREAARLLDDAAVLAVGDERATLESRAEAARTAGGPGGTSSRQPSVLRLEQDLEAAVALGDEALAHRIATDLFHEQPGHGGAFAVLSAAARTKGDVERLAKLTAVRVGSLSAGPQRSDLWFDLARRQRTHGDTPGAIASLDRALIEDSRHTGALAARAELAVAAEDWTTAEVLYAQIQPDQAGMPVDSLLLQRSVVAERIGRDTDALALANAAARANPLRRDCHLRVVALARAAGNLDVAAAAAQTVVALTDHTDHAAVARARIVLAELAEACGSRDAAVSQLELILLDDPYERDALERLVALHKSRRRFPMAVRHLRTLIAHTEPPKLRAMRLAELGDILCEHLGDEINADDAYLRAADLDPGNHAIMRRLLDTYWRSRDIAEMVEIASGLARAGELMTPDTKPETRARCALALAWSAAHHMAESLLTSLGPEAPVLIADTLAELAQNTSATFSLDDANTAMHGLRKAVPIDLEAMRARARQQPPGVAERVLAALRRDDEA